MLLKPFADEHVPAAAKLLALRHRVQCAAEPLLPVQFAQPAMAAKALAAAWTEPGATGVAAFSGRRLAGFLIGTVREDLLRGRHAWMDLAGHAIGPDQSPELYRDMYAALAAQWVHDGCLNHYAMVPAADRAALEAWFGLCFAHEQVHGLRRLGPTDGPDRAGASGAPDHGSFVPAPAGVDIRQAGPGDLELLLDVADLITNHQVGSPCFAVPYPDARAGWREGWTELLAARDATVWIAQQDGRALSFVVFVAAEHSGSDMLGGDGCVLLEVAATRPEFRGQGLGRFLAEHGLAEAARAGFTRCLADWRAANLLSSRFWPRLGFVPVAYRLSRRLDPRIAQQ